MKGKTEAFVGIDVAFAKRKRLPICVCTRQNDQLVPLSIPLELFAKHPRGHGNKGALNPLLVNAFADEVAVYLHEIESRLDLAIRRIAIDAPLAQSMNGAERRECEAAFAVHFRTSAIFKTPGRIEFDQICAKAMAHLESGGAESKFPNANRLWMLVGFDLFRRLRTEWECIEVYPYATMLSLGAAAVHKRETAGAIAQLEVLRRYTGWPKSTESDSVLELRRIVGAPGHDAIDAYASAWIAALEPPDRLPLGCPPHDAIWVPSRRFAV